MPQYYDFASIESAYAREFEGDQEAVSARARHSETEGSNRVLKDLKGVTM